MSSTSIELGDVSGSSVTGILSGVGLALPPAAFSPSSPSHGPSDDLSTPTTRRRMSVGDGGPFPHHSDGPPPHDPILASHRLDSLAPDGGREGWIVVFACAVVTWWFVGTSYSCGVMQDVLVTSGLSSPGTLAFVGSMALAFISALAIVNARIARRMGARRTALLGVALLGGANVLAGSATKSLGGLFVTSGALAGLGMSLCYTVVAVAPAQYFTRKRGLANGVVFAGGGFGGAVISFGLEALLQRLGPAWTYRVLGGAMLLTGLPAAWLIKERTPIRTGGFVEWRLFKDFSFVVIFLAGAIGTFPLLVPPFFLPLYCRSIGLSSGTGAGLVAGFNFSSAVSRIACGFFCDQFGSLNTLFASMLLGAISMLALWPASTTFGPMVAFVIINGAANGGFFAVMPTVVGNVFGSARVSVAMGMIATGWMGGYLLGAPIAGYLLDAYGGAESGLQAYRPAMFYAGSMALGASGLVLMVRLGKSRNPFAKV